MAALADFIMAAAANVVGHYICKRTKKQKIPLDRGEKVAYNRDSQSEDREQYPGSRSCRERMAGENPPPSGWEGPLERGEEMPRRSPPLPGQSAYQPDTNSGGTTDIFVRPEPRGSGRFSFLGRKNR